MRYADYAKIPDDAVIVLVHIPRTSGTSFRRMLEGLLGASRCLLTYGGEIETATAAQLAPIRLVAGHVGYGLHSYFDRPSRYVSFVRDPFDRFMSLYSIFRLNPGKPAHALATRYDINDFVKVCLDPDNAWFYHQINNLQCRLICGEPSFASAQAYVREKYYAVLPFEQAGDLSKLACAALGISRAQMPHVHDTSERRKEFAAQGRLSDESLDLLSRSEHEDILLHAYVRARAASARDELRKTADEPRRAEPLRLDARRPLRAYAKADAAWRPADACPICAGTSFTSGPNGRLAVDGMAPRCERCGSLERHRAVFATLQSLPAGFMDWRRAIQFSRDGSLRDAWFRSVEYSEHDGGAGLDLQALARPDASYDFISLNHVLESVPDDRAAMRELVRVLSARGVLQVTFGLHDGDQPTTEFAAPQHEWAAYRRYGADVLARLDVVALGLGVVVVEALDPCTRTRVMVHFLCKGTEPFELLSTWLGAVGDALRIVEARG